MERKEKNPTLNIGNVTLPTDADSFEDKPKHTTETYGQCAFFL